MDASKNKERGLLIIVVFIGLFIITKTVRFSLSDGEIALTITKQNGGIQTIDTRRNPANTHKMYVKKLEFPQGRMLKHAQYGKIGFSNNFFIDAEVLMHVKKASDVNFYVRSDDGFRLKIDNKIACQHPGDRPMRTTTCKMHLSPGIHPLSLSYFQGGGPMGLETKYQRAGGKSYVIGEDSDEIVFKAVRQ